LKNAETEQTEFEGTNPTLPPVMPPTVTTPSGDFSWSGVGPAPRTRINGRITGYASGTDYVPSTGLYQLHKGEAVVPAGKNSGGSPIIININNPVVNNPNDISKLAQALENVVRANLTDKQTGRSKYRMA